MIYEILKYPDPRLFTVAEPVTEFNDELREIIKNMYETMEANDGVGLAATQVNIHKQIIVIKINEKSLTLINPIIENESSFQIPDDKEGCLSFPKLFIKKMRPTHITVTAYDEYAFSYTVILSDIWAICVSHEIEHINGKTFIDDLSDFKKKLIKERLNKL